MPSDKNIESEDFSIGEIWLSSANNESLQLSAFAGFNENIAGFYSENHHFKYIDNNTGLPDYVWEKRDNLLG